MARKPIDPSMRVHNDMVAFPRVVRPSLALSKIKYTLKPLDIVLIHTGSGALQETDKYLTDAVGMTGEATHWMLDQGVKVAGIDAITFTAAPVRAVAIIEA